MKDESFEELIASVREGGTILRGELKPARSFQVALPQSEDIQTMWMLAIARECSEELADEHEDIYRLTDEEPTSAA